MSAGLDPALTFEAFVPGAANQLALAAARALAEAAAPPFVPLYLHGPPGTGKTHLLHAIGGRALKVMPQRTVRAVGWSEWTDGLRTAHALGRGAEYLAPFDAADLLLVDEVSAELPVGELRAELVALIRHRVAHRLPTVLAGPSALLDAASSHDALAELVGAGLAVELHVPDRALRQGVLLQCATQADGGLSRAVLEAVADLPMTDLRDVRGAWRRLVAFQAVSAAPLDVAQARVLVTGVADPEPGFPGATATLPREPVAHPAPVPDSAAAPGDEYGTFLSDIVASVSQQVDAWRGRVADAILRWDGEGYRTERLQALLASDAAVPPDEVLAGFERDVATLRRLQAELEAIAPDLAGAAVLFDPDGVASARELLESARTQELVAAAPLPPYTWASVAEGISNREAIEALRSLAAEGPGPSLPVLVIGDTGVGKTHLLHALGNALVAEGRRGVVVLGGHAFAAQVAEARTRGDLPGWRARFRFASALLLDDVHLLATDPAAQEEAAALLGTLLAAGRPVACTSAVPLAHLAGGTALFLSRLASGRVVDLPGPDREMRRAVAFARLEAAGAERGLVADLVADLPLESLRAVETAVHQVLHAAEAVAAPPSLSLARTVLMPPTSTGTSAWLPPARGVRAFGWDRLREKLVGEWPSPADHLSEEYR